MRFEERPKPVGEEVTELFSVSPGPTNAQKQIRKRVLMTLHRFLCKEIVSSPKKLQSLAAQFQNTKIPDHSIPVERYLDSFEANVLRHSTNMLSRRCMGHMASALPNFIWTLGELVIALNQNLVKREASRTFSLVERQTIAMIHRLIFDFSHRFYEEHVQKEVSTLGIAASGGTLANTTALWIARNSCFGPASGFRGIEEEGLPAALDYYGYKRAVVVGPALMHYSIEKAVSMLGVGACNLIRIPVDQQGRLHVAALRETIADCKSRRIRVLAIIGNAGTTDCGSLDSLSEIATIAERGRIHFHVDAAWGAPLLFSRRHRHKLAGIERADSVTVDGHKQFYLPIGTSILLLRNPQAARVIEKHAWYMLEERSGDLGKRSLEGSRPGTILFFHAALHIIGSKGYAFLIDENMRKAKAMAKLILERDEFELLVEPETNIVLYRYLPEAFRRKAAQGRLRFSDDTKIDKYNLSISRIQSDAGRTFVSRTSWEQHRDGLNAPIVAFRAVIANPLTTETDIEAVLKDQLRIGAQLR